MQVSSNLRIAINDITEMSDNQTTAYIVCINLQKHTIAQTIFYNQWDYFE